MGLTFKGGRELGRKLALLRTDIAQKAAFSAVFAAAKLVKAEAQRKAPIAPGPYKVQAQAGDVGVIVQPQNIGRNIVTKKVKNTQHTAEYVVAVRGKRKDGYANRIAILQEFGAPHGQHTQAFMGPALDTEKERAVETMAQILARRIEAASK